MPKGIHDKHRERVRDEFLANGFSLDTPPHKIVEMLLFYSIPRKDTNETAHLLLDKFGSIEALLDAKTEELTSVEGVGKNTAAFLQLIKFTASYYINEKKKDVKILKDYDEICEFISNKYLGLKKENFGVTSFDSMGRIAGFDFIGEGSIEELGIQIRKIIEVIIKRNAVGIIISHNHPGGFATPSYADVVATSKLNADLEHINVRLIDHIIIGERDHVSLRSSQDYCHAFSNSKTDETNQKEKIYVVTEEYGENEK